MKIAIIQISEASNNLVSTLQKEMGCVLIARNSIAENWKKYNAFVFIGALGICVRTIAPYIEDKYSDPAIVCIDSMGRQVISVLSGHVGGANELTLTLAGVLGSSPVITTQSDQVGLWALDTLQQRFGWQLAEGSSDMNDCIFTFVGQKPTALLIETRDEGTDYLERTLPKHVSMISDINDVGQCQLLIVVSPFLKQYPIGVKILHFIPKIGVIGFGLAHRPDDYLEIEQQINRTLADQGVLPCAKRYCTIDVKAEEPFVELVRSKGYEIEFFTAEQLAAIKVPNPSPVVQKHVDTPSVCEAAAILGAGNGQLVVQKVKGKNWTAAMAIPSSHLTIAKRPYVEIVGAGPGAPDLISVRGKRFLEQADLILYAGSLVPRELTNYHKAGAVVRSSASMTLEEQCQLMKQHYDKGHFIVRLHTGDPCIFGAIQEQMAFFDREGMSYHITPGISSFLAAAAELQSQFTIPERTQTIILTRGEGRTPMPEREQLHLLARSQSTMCIFLSAAIVDDVQRELLMEYPADTPVAACYHLTWPDQRIFRGVLKDLAKMVHDNHLTLTTMLVVGEAIDNRKGLSELYNRHFTHLFRKGEG